MPGIVFFQLLFQVGLDVLDLISELLNLIIEAHHQALETQWNWVLRIVQQRRHAVQGRDTDGQANPELQQKTMNLISRRRPMLNQRASNTV
ncbi:hypothetical protein D9M73_144190 [compost metagenome]